MPIRTRKTAGACHGHLITLPSRYQSRRAAGTRALFLLAVVTLFFQSLYWYVTKHPLTVPRPHHLTTSQVVGIAIDQNINPASGLSPLLTDCSDQILVPLTISIARLLSEPQSS